MIKIKNSVILKIDMTNNNANLIHKGQAAGNRILFWAAVIATVFQVGWLTLEMLDYQPVLFEMTAVYLLILITYAIQNRVLKWRDGAYKTRRGELFVYFFWIYTFVVYTLYIVDIIVKIPQQLSATFSGVTVIFFGSEVIKLVGRMLQKK